MDLKYGLLKCPSVADHVEYTEVFIPPFLAVGKLWRLSQKAQSLFEHLQITEKAACMKPWPWP